MLPEERALHAELQSLVAQPRGRHLLQLALRGLEADDRGLTCGCWEQPGEAGCLFQHAYWQGVREGVFDEGASAREAVSTYAGAELWWQVVAVIEAFDRLGRAGYSDRVPRRLFGRRRTLRREAWRAAVVRMLLDALDGAEQPQPPPAAVPR